MKSIYKYYVDMQDTQIIEVHANATILTAQIQGSNIYLWAMIDLEGEKEKLEVNIFGTGNPLPSNPGNYISTVQLNKFVWHIFTRAI